MRWEGANVFEGATEVGGLRVFIPYSYNMQGSIFVRGESVEPGFLKLCATGAFLVDSPDAAGLRMQEASMGGTTLAEAIQLIT